MAKGFSDALCKYGTEILLHYIRVSLSGREDQNTFCPFSLQGPVDVPVIPRDDPNVIKMR